MTAPALPVNWVDYQGMKARASYLNVLDQAVLDLWAAQWVTINPRTDSYTLTLADMVSRAVEVSKATATTITIPTHALVAFPVGTFIEIVQVGAGQVTVAGSGGVTVNSAASLKTRAQWSALGIRQRLNDVWLLTGDME